MASPYLFAAASVALLFVLTAVASGAPSLDKTPEVAAAAAAAAAAKESESKGLRSEKLQALRSTNLEESALQTDNQPAPDSDVKRSPYHWDMKRSPYHWDMKRAPHHWDMKRAPHHWDVKRAPHHWDLKRAPHHWDMKRSPYHWDVKRSPYHYLDTTAKHWELPWASDASADAAPATVDTSSADEDTTGTQAPQKRALYEKATDVRGEELPPPASEPEEVEDDNLESNEELVEPQPQQPPHVPQSKRGPGHAHRGAFEMSRRAAPLSKSRYAYAVKRPASGADDEGPRAKPKDDSWEREHLRVGSYPGSD